MRKAQNQMNEKFALVYSTFDTLKTYSVLRSGLSLEHLPLNLNL